MAHEHEGLFASRRSLEIDGDLHRDDNGIRIVFRQSVEPALFPVDVGTVDLSGAYIMPDLPTPFGKVVSNALTGLLYVSPSGEETTAEVFDPSDGERLDGDYEIYPLDGKNMPFTITLPENVGGSTEEVLAVTAARAMYWYTGVS